MVSCAGSIRNVLLWLFSFFASDDIFLSTHAIQTAISWLVALVVIGLNVKLLWDLAVG